MTMKIEIISVINAVIIVTLTIIVSPARTVAAFYSLLRCTFGFPGLHNFGSKVKLRLYRRQNASLGRVACNTVATEFSRNPTLSH